MMRGTFFTLFATVILGLAVADSVDLDSADVAAPGGYVIWDGNCNNVANVTLVSTDHVNLMALPLYKRDHTTEWHGDKIITCVTVLNMKGTENSGTAHLTTGGFGHSFVSIFMESDRGYGIEFLVNIYAV